MTYRGADWKRIPQEAGSNQSELYINEPQFRPVKFGFGESEAIEITRTGYIYIWLSNESKNTRVWFDDLTITHTQNLVVQATDYGVWGDVLREQKSEDKKYRFGYQGQYAERDEETGWNHFELREYDPVIGRWLIVDPYRDGWSPYIAMRNNPISTVDPDGGCPDGCNGKIGDIIQIRGKDRIWNGDDWVPLLDDVIVSTPRMTLREMFSSDFIIAADALNVQYPQHMGLPSGKQNNGFAGVNFSSGNGQGLFQRKGHVEEFYNIDALTDSQRADDSINSWAKLFTKWSYNSPPKIAPSPPETRDSTVHGKLEYHYTLDGGAFQKMEAYKFTIKNKTNEVVKIDTTWVRP